MKLIVAVDSNWGIGLRNALLVHIPSDMKFFRSETMGKTIIMGRKTLESFPQAQPLAGRNNIVITKDPAYQVKGAVVVHSIEEAIEESKKYDTDVYCIGGESVTASFCHIVTKPLSRRLITLMKQTAFSRIWMKCRNGK